MAGKSGVKQMGEALTLARMFLPSKETEWVGATRKE